MGQIHHVGQARAAAHAWPLLRCSIAIQMEHEWKCRAWLLWGWGLAVQMVA